MSTHTDPSTVPYLDFNDGHRIPQLGFGVFQVPLEETAKAVRQALQTGYRSIDTAAAYENEAGVGEALTQSDLDREEVFLTTKLWNDKQGHDSALKAFEASLEQLGQDYVDLYLIHWPAPDKDAYVETWQAFTELKEQGRARSIGVSNFLPEHLERIIDATGVVPAINQIELHPRLRAGRAARVSPPARHPDGSLEPAGPGRRAGRARDRGDRLRARSHAGAGGPALARAARQRGYPQVRDARADRGELPDLRLRAHRRPDVGHGRARCRRPYGARSRDVVLTEAVRESRPMVGSRHYPAGAVPDVEAHITGTVWKIEVEVGDSVQEGDTVVILESMKMEMPVEAEDPGVVSQILCEEGQSVSEGDTLVVLE